VHITHHALWLLGSIQEPLDHFRGGLFVTSNVERAQEECQRLLLRLLYSFQQQLFRYNIKYLALR